MTNNQNLILSKMTGLPLPDSEYVHSESYDYYFSRVDINTRSQHENLSCNEKHNDTHMEWLKQNSLEDQIVICNYMDEIINILIQKINQEHDNKSCHQVHSSSSHTIWLLDNEASEYNNFLERSKSEFGLISFDEQFDLTPEATAIEDWQDKSDFESFVISIFKYIPMSFAQTIFSKDILNFKESHSFYIKYFSYFFIKFLIKEFQNDLNNIPDKILLIAAPNSTYIPFYEQLNSPNERLCQIVSSYFNIQYIPCHLTKTKTNHIDKIGKGSKEQQKINYFSLLESTILSEEELSILFPEFIILFDDVFTTGTTFRANKDIIWDKYKCDIYSVNLARTQKLF